MSAALKGFANPIFDAQAVFKAVMMAMARPGEIKDIGPFSPVPAPFNRAAASIALALLDYETPVWLDEPLAASPEITQWIKFHAAAAVSRDASQAAFAFVSDPLQAPPLSAFAPGTLDYPDRSTTIVMQVQSLTAGRPISLSGPGVEASRRISPEPVPDGLVQQLTLNRSMFPRGVDLILAADGAVAALPRSTSVILGS